MYIPYGVNSQIANNWKWKDMKYLNEKWYHAWCIIHADENREVNLSFAFHRINSLKNSSISDVFWLYEKTIGESPWFPSHDTKFLLSKRLYFKFVLNFDLFHHQSRMKEVINYRSEQAKLKKAELDQAVIEQKMAVHNAAYQEHLRVKQEMGGKFSYKFSRINRTEELSQEKTKLSIIIKGEIHSSYGIFSLFKSKFIR